MNRVMIVGGGFAGLAALQKLAGSKLKLKISLIDKRKQAHFLPMLPDVLGRGITTDSLSYNLADLCKKLKVEFVNAEVVSVDLEKRQLITRQQALEYDYLLLAAGSSTNFYGQEQIENAAYKLDSLQDARQIFQAVEANTFDTFIIAGAGYTGIEVATNLRRYFDKNKLSKRIIIVELSSQLLGPLPDWMKSYVAGNLKSLNIETRFNAKIASIENQKVYLSGQENFEPAMLIWTAGVKTADFIAKLNLPQSRQGRLKVDDYLRVRPNCFAAGDAAEFSYQGASPLRMAIQFALAQGRAAAINILRQIQNRPLQKYRPRDYGYVIPMANNKSCGIILGANLRGCLPTLMHYLMCIYRSFSVQNKLSIIKQLSDASPRRK
ncbi:NAD(P)/FAD-dependent oxidoreductase [Candidatus Omnitrophota bacterium]